MEYRRDVFQAIADPTRREILRMLIREPQNLSSLAENFKMSRQAVSLHVRILDECDVIEVRKQGRERYCELKPGSLSEIARWLEPFRKLWEDRLDQLDDLLNNL